MTAKQQQLTLIRKAIEAAEKLGNKRDVYTLNSLLRHRQKRKLTYRQEDFLKKQNVLEFIEHSPHLRKLMSLKTRNR